jgi:hypothetical protein
MKILRYEDSNTNLPELSAESVFVIEEDWSANKGLERLDDMNICGVVTPILRFVGSG